MKTSVKVGRAAAGLAGLALLAGGIWGVSSIHIPNGSDPKPEPTVTAATVVESRALVGAPVHAEPASVDVVTTPDPVTEQPAEPSGPDLCPAGTRANSNDGTNDTSCLPEVCYTLRGLPDPDHPECDYAYPPEYYR